MKIRVNNVSATIVEAEDQERKIVKGVLTFLSKNARHTWKFKKGWWDGKTCILRNNVFLAGLTGMIARELRSHGYQLHAYREPEARPPRRPPQFRPELIQGITPYPFQERVVKRALNRVRGVIHSTTGSGKTEMGVMLAGSIILDPTTRDERRGIWLTHSRDLLRQTKKRFELRCPELKVGIIGDGVWNPSQFTIAMVNTLHKRIKKNNESALQFLNSISAAIFDEVHFASSDIWQVTAAHMPNALWRYGLTATPNLREALDNVRVEGVVGPVITSVSAKELIDLGLLAEPHIWFIKYKNPRPLPGRIEWDKAYEYGVIKNNVRNSAICQVAKKEVRRKNKTLILVARVEHGKNIISTLEKNRLNGVFIWGDNSTIERAEIISDFINGEFEVLVASTILDTGIDIPEIDSIIIAGGMRSSVRTYQRVGRGMRKRGDKRQVRVFDFVDDQHPSLLKQSKQRYKDYKNESGYVIEGLIDLATHQ